MKILFICENYLPHYGGAEVVFKNLAERFVEQGETVKLLTQQLKKTKKKEIIGGVQIQRVFSFFSRYLFTFLAIPSAIKLARKCDLIQTTTFNGAFPAWLAGKMWNKPVVLTVHEVWINKWKMITHFSYLKRTIHEFLERMIYLLPFDQYICVSEATRRDLLKKSINPKKIKTIHNGFAYEQWNPKQIKKINLAQELGIKKKNFIYFSWGRPGESKGFEYAIRAVPLIAKEVPNSLFLLMLGSADRYNHKYQELMRLRKKLNLQERMLVINSAPREILQQYLKTVDCVVIPSLAEGFGYTTVEACAMGKSVVISNAGSLPEVVSGKHQIFESKNVLDLAEKVVKIAQGEYLDAGTKKFAWPESIENYLKTYRELMLNKNVRI